MCKVRTEYATADHEHISEETPSGATAIRELHAIGMAEERISLLAGVEFILGGSMSFRPIQTRLNEVVPVLRTAVDGDLSRLSYVMDAPDIDGMSLHDLVSKPVVDLNRVKSCIENLSNGIGRLWSPEIV